MKRITMLVFVGFFIFSGTANADLMDGLVASYLFDGNANDSSGHGYNGTNNGATATIDRFGNPNGALNFNGSSNYVDLASLVPVLTGQGQGSISMWFMHGPSTLEHPENPFDVLLSGPGTNGWLGLYLGNDGSNLQNESVAFFYPGPVDGGYLNGHSFYLDSNWHHVVIEMGSDFNALYIDGIKMQTVYGWNGNETSGNSMWEGLTRLAIGHNLYQPSPYFFTGLIDDVRIYNRALDSTEVGQLYNMDPVPEPATMLLLGSGIIGLAGIRRRLNK